MATSFLEQAGSSLLGITRTQQNQQALDLQAQQIAQNEQLIKASSMQGSKVGITIAIILIFMLILLFFTWWFFIRGK